MRKLDASQFELEMNDGGAIPPFATAPRAATASLEMTNSESSDGSRGAKTAPPKRAGELDVASSGAGAGLVESLLSFAQAAKSLGISLRQFRRLVDGGKIAFVKVSERSPRIRPSELQRFLAASVVKYSEVKS
jgi:excisionase family DNA binding protein